MLDEDFCSRISRDWLNREGDLSEVDRMILRKKSETHLKSAILISYSHWEGHFKFCAETLLNYIAEGVKRKIFNWTDVKEDIRLRLLFCNYRKASISAQKHETFLSYLNALSDRRFSDIVNAKSEIIMIDDNLNSSRAEAICRNLGVDCSWFLAKSVIIDQRLLDHRNCFAHGASRLRGGELVDYADSSLWECVDEVRALIRHTKDQFQNSINIRSFLS